MTNRLELREGRAERAARPLICRFFGLLTGALTVCVALLGATPLLADDDSMAERYRAIVALWAEDPSAGASVALAELETDPDLRTDVLEKVIERVDRALVRREPRASIALAHLHGQAYARVLRGWRPDPSRFQDPIEESAKVARKQMLKHVDRMRAPDLGGRDAAAQLLAAMGFTLSDLPGGHHHRASEVFSRALVENEELQIALHGRAFLSERRGEYGGAAVTLGRLLDVYPDDHEARLRLGVVEAQRGELASGLAALERVAAGDGPDWVRILAFQELARWNQRRDPDVARQWLAQGLESFPDDPRLRLQNALAGGHRWDEATDQVVSWVEDWQPADRPSPRLRYDFGPIDDRRVLMNEVSTHLSQALPDLRRAVASGDRFTEDARSEADQEAGR